MPILTPRLREYLKCPESFSPNYRRYLRHVLKKRVVDALEELDLIAEKDPGLLDLFRHVGKSLIGSNTPSKSEVEGSSPSGPVYPNLLLYGFICFARVFIIVFMRVSFDNYEP